MNKKNLDLYLPDTFKGLTKNYIMECIFDEAIQKAWQPNIGDIIVTYTGNIYVISAKRELVEELGGTIYIFGGSLCARTNDRFLNSTSCYLMNKDGKNHIKVDTDMSKISDFRYVPYPHERFKPLLDKIIADLNNSLV